MGIFLIVTVISLIVAFLAYVISEDDNIAAILGFTISFVVCSIIPFAIICTSYGTYVDARTQYDATINQYREAVTMYSDHAIIDAERAFTDFKYQGYQENIAEFIKSLRCEVTSYNKNLISKRIMNKNFFFNWVIITPDDDMKILSLAKRGEENNG